ncbi:MAG: enoyl-CoA hydratase/isomerase family protein [Myxococcota bacterium]|nr:enoyl-CoA hydratase/isomerase family protein [Myxococcota bacterium]
MDTLLVERTGSVCTVTLHRPHRRNAMNSAMVRELHAVLDTVLIGEVRILVLRGADGHFCAGGDIQDMAAAAGAEPSDGTDPIAIFNRTFGALIERVDALPCAVIALCEGAVMGGGFGLACVADVVIAVEGTRFRLPETSLGISPAQIAPFVVRRVGHSHARRLAVTGETLDAQDAVRLHLAHAAAPDAPAGEALLSSMAARILRNEPHAVAETKRVVSQPAHRRLGDVLDDAAAGFARLARSETAAQGFAAFLRRSPAPWVPVPEDE